MEIADHVASSLWRGRANRKQARHDEALRARGVLAPAVVVSATTRRSRSSVDGAFIGIRDTVDVHPHGAAPFRAQFVHWSERRGYTAIMGEIQGEAGRQLWVTFDPADPSEMIFEYFEEERIARRQAAELEARRAAFVARAEPLEPLRTQGVPAHAIIVHVGDLQVPFPGRKSIAVDLHVDVTPQGGATYRAVIPALVGVAALGKYSAGRRAFVRIDPRDPSRVILDSERNRTLPD